MLWKLYSYDYDNDMICVSVTKDESYANEFYNGDYNEAVKYNDNNVSVEEDLYI